MRSKERLFIYLYALRNQLLLLVSSGSKETDGEIVIGYGRISISRHVGLDRGSGSSAVLGLNPDLLV